MARISVIIVSFAIASVVGCLQLGCERSSVWTEVTSNEVTKPRTTSSKESLEDNVNYLTINLQDIFENGTALNNQIGPSSKADECREHYIISNGKSSLLVLIGLGGALNGYLAIACLFHSL